MGDKLGSDGVKPIETWEELLNVQRVEYKEEPQPVNLTLQFGVITKFMRWVK